MAYVYSIPRLGCSTAQADLARKYGILLERHNRYRMQSRVGLIVGCALALDVVQARLAVLDDVRIAA